METQTDETGPSTFDHSTPIPSPVTSSAEDDHDMTWAPSSFHEDDLHEDDLHEDDIDMTDDSPEDQPEDQPDDQPDDQM